MKETYAIFEKNSGNHVSNQIAGFAARAVELFAARMGKNAGDYKAVSLVNGVGYESRNGLLVLVK